MKAMPMKMEFNAGHPMTWYAEAGHALGTITKKIISTIAFKDAAFKQLKNKR